MNWLVATVLDLEKATEMFHRWAQKNPYVGELRIFGSYAKGTFRLDSDLDIAVRVVRVKPGDTNVWVTALCECPQWGKELTEILGVKIDMHDITGTHVSQYVQEASILVYLDEMVLQNQMLQEKCI